MGKEWYWTGRSSKRSEGGDADSHNPSGCMCAFFHFFDFHPIHFPIQHHQKLPYDKPEDHTIPKGAEAPRNSLESEDGTMSYISKEEDLKIPMRMQIKTSRRINGGNESDISSEISSSPCTKTPTLVARLMGLDLLPDAQSPSSSSSCVSTPNTHGNSRLHHYKQRQSSILTKHRKSTGSDIAPTRSLPETPRISSARRSDADHHRLSLQINKENMGLGEDLELPRFSFSKRKLEEQNCRSPSHYARQIVKHVKDSVTRKVGLDITNTVKTREHPKEELVLQIRVKKSPKTSLKVIDESSSPGKNTNPPSSSPRLRFMERTKSPSPLNPKDQNSQPLKPSHPPINIQPKKSVPKCKKDGNERFNARLKKPLQTSDIMRNKQEESFVRPLRSSPPRANDTKIKGKRSSNLLNLTSIPNLRPVKIDPSPPETKIPQKQEADVEGSTRSTETQSYNCPTQTYYKQEPAKTILADAQNDKSHGPEGPHHGPSPSSEFHYITNLLNIRTPHKNQPSLKLSPSVFHNLEQHYCVEQRNDRLGLRCNRRLLFDLVDEIVGEMEKAGVKWEINNVADLVWRRIMGFPEARCEVLEDIDGLIEREDMGKMMKEGLNCKEEEEGGVVAEIERSIVDMLVGELVGGE